MNSNILRLAKNEFYNIFKSVLIKVTFAISIIYVFLWLKSAPSSFSVKDYLAQYFLAVKFVIILASVYILGSDFKNDTYKYIFTGCFSRKSIVLGKIMAIFGVGIVCWIVQVLLKIIIALWTNIGTRVNDIFGYELFSTLVIYILVALLIGSFSILVTSISFKLNITMIYTVLFFGIVQFYAPLFIISVEKANVVPFWFQLIKILPTYIIFDWMDTFRFQLDQVIFMLTYIILCLGCSIFILNRKDLNK